MWFLTSVTSNLSPDVHQVISLSLVVLAGVVGATCGALISRHLEERAPVVYGATVGALGGAICGAAYATLFEFALVATYGGAPENIPDAIVVGVSFPVFALIGSMVGAATGGIFGAAGGFVGSRLAGPASRMP
jgi:hypothetical protein